MAIEENDLPKFIEFIQNDYYAYGPREPEHLISEWKRISMIQKREPDTPGFYCAQETDSGPFGRCINQCGNCRHAEGK